MNYENTVKLDTAYNDFITWLNFAVNKILLIHSGKKTTAEWFDGKIVDMIHTRDKLHKRFRDTFKFFDEVEKKKEHLLKILKKITSP